MTFECEYTVAGAPGTEARVDCGGAWGPIQTCCVTATPSTVPSPVLRAGVNLEFGYCRLVRGHMIATWPTPPADELGFPANAHAHGDVLGVCATENGLEPWP